MSRREFPPSVIFAILKRATKNGRLICEGCGMDVTGKKADVDHTLADALVMEKRALTAEDGKLLGKDCCHKPKTAADIKVIRKADRQRKFHAGFKSTGRPLNGTRASGIRIRMNRAVEKWT